MNSSEFLLCSLNKGKQIKINYINRELKGALLKLLSVFGNNEKKFGRRWDTGYKS